MVHVFVRVHMRPRMCEHLYCVRACVLEREREGRSTVYKHRILPTAVLY